MKTSLFRIAFLASGVLGASLVVSSAQAGTYNFWITDGGITASGTFMTSTSIISGAETIVNAYGTFTDANVGFTGAITGVEAAAAPSSQPPFGSPSFSSAGYSYDNLLWASGSSPKVCADYDFFGGYMDCYGILMDVSGGYTADLWSNGVFPGTTAPSYGLSDAQGGTKVGGLGQSGDAVNFTIQAVPEPSSFAFLGAGVLGLVAVRRKRSA